MDDVARIVEVRSSIVGRFLGKGLMDRQNFKRVILKLVCWSVFFAISLDILCASVFGKDFDPLYRDGCSKLESDAAWLPFPFHAPNAGSFMSA